MFKHTNTQMKKLIKQISKIDKSLAREATHVLGIATTKIQAKKPVDELLDEIVQETYKEIVELSKEAGYKLNVKPRDYEQMLKKTLQGKLV